MLTMNEYKIVKEAIAEGKTYLANGTLEMNSQLKAGISKEHRVVKAYEENDSYVETWRFIDGTKGYTGRDTMGETWYDYICGVDDGYFEPNAHAKDDVVYILCSPKGEELMVAGNGCGCDFPTTSTALNEFFAENFPKHQSFVDWKKWLLRFRDPSIPEIREWLNAEPCHCYEENWLFNRDTLKSRTLKKEFQFLGETYYIFEDSRVHKISGTCWTEYSVSKQATPKDDFEVSILGYSFDENNVGNGMSQAETEALIKNLLVEVFGPLDFSVRPRSYDSSKNMIEIRDDYACALPDYDVLSQVMHKLKGANKAYNRKEVQDSLAELKDYVKEKYFLNSKEGVAALIEKYPDIQLGYPLNVYYHNRK